MKPYKWDECCCLPGLVDENLSNSGVIIGGSYTQHMGSNWLELDMELFYPTWTPAFSTPIFPHPWSGKETNEILVSLIPDSQQHEAQHSKQEICNMRI
jgi:hypothetical protein